MKASLLPGNPADRRLWVAIAISLLFHGLLLSLHFAFPEASRVAREKALDIILVNARSSRAPSDAQALAQANLDGGGNTDESRRAKTPLPPTERQLSGDDLQQMRKRVQELEAAQQKMLAQARSLAKVAAAETRSEQPAPAAPLSGLDLADAARAMARLEGEINKSVEEYNKRPQKKFVGARTQEYALAPYFDAWKQKIERIGTLNYPDEARGKLYGRVIIFVELRVEDGSLYNAEISRSSGHKVLDQAALRILRMAAPFGPIPREAMGGASVLSFAREWNFVPGDTLATGNR
ncbi:energy transducer TonB [Azonexus fungiphilus]|uniref:energy transducer TonB n=1 Tax=Azonexus fungiphilus TaxID=146940 RepID=UPI001C2C683F|nr:TonB family protein [Azonexus fungiphilus]